MARTRVSEERFVVSYDGPALENHTMNARDLARSVLAMSDAFHEAQRVLRSPAAPATLNIQAFNTGSFEVFMTLVEGAQSSLLGLRELLNHESVDAGLNAVELGGLFWGAVKVLQKIRGRRFRLARTDDEPGRTTLTFENGETLAVASETVDLIRDVEFRRRLLEVLEPLKREGVDEFRVRGEGEVEPFEITSSEVVYYEVRELPEEEDLGTIERPALLQLLGVEFDTRKWRFTEGGSPIWASIEDDGFRERIELQEVVFGSNDLLRVTLRTRQFKDREGRLKQDIAVVRVHEHIPGGQQLALDFDEPDEPESP